LVVEELRVSGKWRQRFVGFDAYTVSIDNSVRYVGITTRGVSNRWRRHTKDTNSCHALRRAIQKYGASAFSIEHVASSKSQEDLDALEQLLIVQYGTMSPRGYNLRSGGKKNCVFSDEARQKISSANRRRMADPEQREKLRRYGTGKKHSAESLAKMSAVHKGLGKPMSIAQKQAFSILRKGVPLSSEHRAKIGAAHKRRFLSKSVVPNQLMFSELPIPQQGQ
jgi:group I intron endonuclease